MKKYLSRLTALLLALILLVVPASALTVEQALELLEEYYYYDIPDEAYEAKTVDELIRMLSDPYTYYMDPGMYQAFLSAIEGDTNLVGIGVTIQYTEQGILIVNTISGGSAREAGLLPGDLIVAIDGVSCVPADDSAGDLISGDEGTTVTLTILRDGSTSTYTLTRRPVIIPNTEIQLLDGGIGYIDCNSFGLDTGEEFDALIRANDDKVNVWLVDLRDNGGGYVQAAADMLNALLGPGRTIYVEYGDGTVQYIAGEKTAATAKPVIVLTDGDSASSSEIVTINIRDAARGITIGTRTYGKGVAQALLDEDVLPEYFDEGDALRVTTYRSYSVGMNTADRIGVIPTLLVDDSQTDAVALALCGDPEKAELGLSFHNNMTSKTRTYGIAPNTDDATLSALLSALPPQIQVTYAGGSYTAPEIAGILGIEYENRWFTDVAGSQYADAINAMGTYELLQGDGKGHFTPKGQLTRAELCTMLANVLNVAYRGPSLFTDVNQEEWYGPSVNAMAYLGLVNGVGNGRFNPGANITQEEFFTIMGRTARFLNLQMDVYGQWVEDGGRLTTSQKAALAPYSDWARSSMAVLAWGLRDTIGDTWSQLGLLYAPIKTLSPKAPILREEAAAGMYAVLAGLDILPIN